MHQWQFGKKQFFGCDSDISCQSREQENAMNLNKCTSLMFNANGHFMNE